MDQDALNRLIATIEELERLFEQAKGDPSSPAWQAMQEKLATVQEQLDRLTPY